MEKNSKVEEKKAGTLDDVSLWDLGMLEASLAASIGKAGRTLNLAIGVGARRELEEALTDALSTMAFALDMVREQRLANQAT